MNTPIDPNDPRLIDFVLGELEPQEAAELEAALGLPENELARQEIGSLKAAIQTSEEALKHEPMPAVTKLSDTRRNAVLANSREKHVRFGRNLSRQTPRLLALAAGLVLCVGLAFYAVNSGKWLATGKMAGNDKGGVSVNAPFEVAQDQQHAGSMVLEPSVRERQEAQLSGAVKTDTADASGTAASTPPAPVPPSNEETYSAEIRLQESKAESPQEAPPSPQVSPQPKPEPAPVEAPVTVSAEAEALRSLGYIDGMSSGMSGGMGGYGGRMSDDESDGDVNGAQTRLNVRADYYDVNFVPGKELTMNDGLVNQPERRFGLPGSSLPFPGGESYTEIQERPFTRTEEQPLSTFSLHADSAAYTNIKRFLQQGQRPPKDAVRIEELINYFSYNYPQPTGEHPFSVNIEVGPCPWAAGHLLAKVGLQGKNMPQEERPPANLVFLVDTSGSMDRPNRLPLVRESLKTLLDMLKPEDRVGIVTYAGESKIALASTPVAQKEAISRTIEGLGAGGSTHGSAGIQDAYAMAQQNFFGEGINRVILATDGDFNVGVTNRDGLFSLIEEKRKSGVFLTVLGYGMGNLKDANLELLATKGNGNYAYIDSFSEARRVLVEQLTGTLMTIAKDAKIQVEFNPGQVQSYRLLGYENRQLAHRDFNDDTKDAGEIGAGHSVTALYQIVPRGAAAEPGVDTLRYQSDKPVAEPPVNGTGELMFVKLRYKQPDGDTSRLIEVPVPARAVSLEESSGEYRFAASVAGFGLLLRDSAYKGNATFDLVRQLATSALGGDPRRVEFLDLVVTARTLVGP